MYCQWTIKLGTNMETAIKMQLKNPNEQARWEQGHSKRMLSEQLHCIVLTDHPFVSLKRMPEQCWGKGILFNWSKLDWIFQNAFWVDLQHGNINSWSPWHDIFVFLTGCLPENLVSTRNPGASRQSEFLDFFSSSYRNQHSYLCNANLPA